jgi:DNA polymerase-3 subunit delta'
VGFDEIWGNPRIKHILTSYLKNDIIPPSMIFFGPGSANMLSFATAFAKGVNCLNKENNPGDFCGTCAHCLEIDKESFLDLQILAPDGQQYKKEQIVYLVEDNFRKPFKGKRKINILTDAHKMNEYSANTFLKVLEEPAPLNVFILMTDNMNPMLPTIKSRCQVLKFSPLSKTEIKTYLVEKGYDDERARLISYLGSNMEKAIDLDFDEFMKKREAAFSVLYSLLTRQGMETILLDLFNRSRSREKFLDYFSELVNLLALMLRDIAVLKIEENSPNVINVDYKEKLMQLCHTITIHKALALIREMEYVLRDIHRNLNTKVLILEFLKSYTGKEVEDV